MLPLLAARITLYRQGFPFLALAALFGLPPVPLSTSMDLRVPKQVAGAGRQVSGPCQGASDLFSAWIHGQRIAIMHEIRSSGLFFGRCGHCESINNVLKHVAFKCTCRRCGGEMFTIPRQGEQSETLAFCTLSLVRPKS
jgi:ribosomal protein S27E